MLVIYIARDRILAGFDNTNIHYVETDVAIQLFAFGWLPFFGFWFIELGNS